MTRALYLDVVGGIAGDMLLAALLDVGASEELLRSVPGRLGIGPVGIEVTPVERQGVRALHVSVAEPPDPPSRTWRSMRRLVERGDLPEPARARSLDVLLRLAEAEATVHGRPVDDVHFHEVGGVDTLVDVCGAALLLEDLGVARAFSSPLPFARGLVKAAHGTLPLPAPATLALLRGAQLEAGADGKELVTPTGAALAASLAESFGPLPAFRLERAGYGAGTDDDPARPNVLRVLLGTLVEQSGRVEVALLETNLDDLNPELVPDAVERCFAAGALDVWVVPVQMKKGRPGIVLSALARPADERHVAAAIFEETSALGVRIARLSRHELEREELHVEVSDARVRVKLGRLDGRVVNVAPEHDDCAAVARASGRSVQSVWAEALARARDA